LEGEVVAAFGRNFLVEMADGRLLQCLPRGKNMAIACGDRVAVAMEDADKGIIESIHQRSSLFFRSVAHRVKLIAANATQLAFVVATDPSFSDELVMRAIAAAEHASMRSLIVLNKIDLTDRTDAAKARLACFVNAGYTVIAVSALTDIGPLAALLENQRTILAGQSGMGKSTIINALCPHENVATRTISTFLASGRHTTSAARLYRLDAESSIIDSPGMQEFGLAHLDRDAIEASMPEFLPYRGQCRFQNCRHGPEPGCALREAVAQGKIDARRFELFHRIANQAGR